MTPSSFLDGFETWLREGPEGMPARDLATLLDRLSVEPQRHRLVPRITGRSKRASTVQAAIATAAAIALAFGALLVMRGGTEVGGPSVRPSASVVSTPTPGVSPIPSRLVVNGCVIDGEGCPGGHLGGADLSGLTMLGSYFGADLTGAKMIGVTADATRFDYATLRDANLSGSTMPGASFVGVDLTGADLVGVDLQGADFDRAILTDADFHSSRFSSQTTFEGALFCRTVMPDASVVSSDCDAVATPSPSPTPVVNGCVVAPGAQCPGADLRGADLHGAIMSNGDFHGADLSGADLEGAIADGAIFDGATMRDVDLRSASLKGASFVGADLTGGDFALADLRPAILRGATLTDVNLRGANLDAESVKGAILCRTIFPDGTVGGPSCR